MGKSYTLKNTWFADAQLGMFIHWGVYSAVGRGEQSMWREMQNPSDYRQRAKEFKAEKFDPDHWAQVAKDGNMKYMVLTTKHHDGYCLWDTQTTDFNAMKVGPKRDLVGEYVRACRKAGLKVGLYFSPPDYNVPACFAGPEKDPEGFREFIRMSWKQLEELVSNYGKIDLLWFDGKWPEAKHWRSGALVKMLRSHQPDIIINNRLPQPKSGADWGYKTPEQRIDYMSDEPWEACMTSTLKCWGYHVSHEDPTMWLSARELLHTFTLVIARGGNLLWNVGPKASGEFPAQYEKTTRLLGNWIRANKEAVYGIEPIFAEFFHGHSGAIARKGNKLFLYFHFWPGETYSIPGYNEKLKSARLLASNKKVEAIQEPHRIILKGMPRKAPDIVTVVELTFDAPPTVHEWHEARLQREFPMPGLDEWAKL